MALALGNLLFIPVALHAHPDAGALTAAVVSWGPLPGGATLAFFTLVLANIGATVTPWMLFFQQSAVVSKGLVPADLGRARLDTAAGAAMAGIVAVAALATASLLFVHHVNAAGFSTGADFATALRPYIGSHAAALFALGMIEAGIVAALTISASSSYTMGEVAVAAGQTRTARSRPVFALTAIASAAVGAATVLIPNAPLLLISLSVNVIAALLMSPALILAMLLANDERFMGALRNGRLANLASGAIIATISVLGVVYAVMNVLPAPVSR
jgi:Mn2+/Fe2+ NRAMP family transporter